MVGSETVGGPDFANVCVVDLQVTCECVRVDATVFIRLLVVVTSLTCV